MRNDEALTAGIFSLNYDLDGDNELDVVSVFQWSGVAISKDGGDSFAPLGGFDPVTATYVGSFQGATTNFFLPRTLPRAAGAFAGGYQMGTVIWVVNAGVNSDGADVAPGLVTGNDVFGDAGFGDMSARVQFNSATVNVVSAVPSQSPAGIAAAGVLMLLAAGCALRRRGSEGRRRRTPSGPTGSGESVREAGSAPRRAPR
jgi:hypothetical protein